MVVSKEIGTVKKRSVDGPKPEDVNPNDVVMC
jgi:hypothetical protein